MKNAYIDTNIVVSSIKPDDIFYSDSKKLLSNSIVNCLSSTLLLVELKAVLTKQVDNIEKNLSREIKNLIKDFTLEEKTEVFFNYVMEKIYLEILEVPTIERLDIPSYNGSIYTPYAISLKISAFTQLKTLDNLHISHIMQINHILNKKIDYFVTTDKMIQKNKMKINELLSIIVITPNKLIELETT
ncbi:MAG: hypothetical protein HeimC3_46370 [Candidatus Heimdallarchaeota archaeon LC_3]|nr:MAG: hypothetical protein HeimC3_46370 [Candidatus Heimdallarchaeota archaeon LC_3]